MLSFKIPINAFVKSISIEICYILYIIEFVKKVFTEKM